MGLTAILKKFRLCFYNMHNPVLEFNRAVIRATSEVAIAYKLNTAFYEARGIAGFRDMEQTLASIPDACMTIADAKRADIGNTSKMYAQAFFEHWPFDALTVAPYMGFDSLEPFFAYEDKLLFVLCLTSNKGSADFEEQIDAGWQSTIPYCAWKGCFMEQERKWRRCCRSDQKRFACRNPP